MGKKAKKKNRLRRPKLSILNKIIYWTGAFLTFALFYVMLHVFERMVSSFAFRDPNVIAAANKSFFFCIPLILYINISALAILISGYEHRTPIFESRKTACGDASMAKDCIPLFDSRRKGRSIPPTQKKRCRFFAAAWSAGLLLCLLVMPLGFFSRDCLKQNFDITSYNLLNQESAQTYTQSDYSNLTIQAHHYVHRSRWSVTHSWSFDIVITMADGSPYSFSSGNFDKRNTNWLDAALNAMTEIKALFPLDQIKVVGQDELPKMILYFHMTDKQAQLLQALFSE